GSDDRDASPAAPRCCASRRAAAAVAPFVRLDGIDGVEHAAAELEERRPGAEHPPAFEGFLGEAPASWRAVSSSVGGEMYMAVAPVRFDVPALSLAGAQWRSMSGLFAVAGGAAIARLRRDPA